MFRRFSIGFIFPICLFLALGCLFACGTTDESTSETADTNTTLSPTEEDPFSNLSFKIIGEEERSYSVIGYKEYQFDYLDESLVIPSEYKGLPVTSIGEKAFYKCINLVNVEIPSTVTKIGASAFSNCSNLRTVVIKEGVLCIDDEAFSYCSNLASLVIPSSVTSIKEGAFEECIKLSEVYNLSDLNIMKGSEENGYIGYYAEVIHKSLEDESVIIKANDFVFKAYNGEYTLLDYVGNESYLILPENINGKEYAISSCAFSGRNNLVSVIIPEGVTSIGNYAFEKCINLKEVSIPSTVKSIGIEALKNCIMLKNVIISEGVENIGEYAFSNCSSLKKIIIPSSVTSIADGTFSSCHNLRNVNIPNTVKTIGQDAFLECRSLTDITIPSSVNCIGSSAFFGCKKLVEIYNLSKLGITKGSMDYGYVGVYAKEIHSSIENESILRKTEDGYVFMINKNTLGESNYYLIDYSGENIHVVLPSFIDGHTYEIYDKAFYCNVSIVNVVIPEGVTKIGSHAFHHCDSLVGIIIPSSIISIDYNAFYECCKLVEVYNLSNLNIEKGSVDNGFVGLYAKIIHSSLEEKSILINTNNYIFMFYNDEYFLLDYIGEEACLKLPVHINRKKYSIYQKAFYECENITSVVISSGVNSIGNYAFAGCTGLISLKIPSSVKSIGGYAFYFCSSLSSVKISKGVKKIDVEAFGRCYNLVGVLIPKGITSISDALFFECKSLRNVTIPDGVTSIGEYAFYSNESLLSFVIPSSVKSIEKYSFRSCGILDNIYYTGTIEQYASISQDCSEIPSDKVIYYSEEKPIDSINKYWHFDEKGKIVIWQD